MNSVETILKLHDDVLCAHKDNKMLLDTNNALRETVDNLSEELYQVYTSLLKKYVHQDSNSVEYIRPIIHPAMDELVILTDRASLIQMLRSISEWDDNEIVRVVDQYFNRLVEEGKANVKRD